MIEIEGEIYHTAASAARYLHITRFMFYDNVKRKVQTYKTEMSRRLLYRQSELEQFRSIQRVHGLPPWREELCMQGDNLNK
jgi:hypothetical protein